jgi:molecular chaperone GrpE
MYEVESADAVPGSVAEEVQAGYVIGERVLRPALVAVAKRAARPEPEKADAAAEKPEEGTESDPGPQAA